MTWRPTRRTALGAALALGAGSAVGCSPNSGIITTGVDSPEPSDSTDGGTPVGTDDFAQRDPADKLTPQASLQLAADGQVVAALGVGEVIFWNVATGKIASRTVYDEDISAYEFNTPWAWSGSMVALAESRGEGIIILVDATTGHTLFRIPVPDGTPRVRAWKLALSPDGSLLTASLTDGTVRIHDTASGKQLRQVEAEIPGKQASGNGVLTPTYAQDGALILSSGSVECPVQFWTGDGARLTRLITEIPTSYHDFQLTPDGGYFSLFRRVAGNTRLLELWDGTTLELLHSYAIPTIVVASALHPAGTHIAWASDWDSAHMNSMYVTNLITGEETKLTGPPHRASSLAYTPDGATLLSMNNRDGILEWDHASGSFRQNFEFPE